MAGKKHYRPGSSSYTQFYRDRIAEEYLGGDLSYLEIAKKYNLPTRDIVQGWVRQYRKRVGLEMLPLGPMTAEEKENVSALQAELKATRKQLEEMRIKAMCYEKLIEISERDLGFKLKKNGSKQ